MRNLTLFLCGLMLACTSAIAQVPFQGVVTTQVMPIRSASLYENVQILYHTSFDGNLKVYINDRKVVDKEVSKGEQQTLKLGNTIPKCSQAIMKIVLDDLFYLEEVLHFHHPYVRLHYQQDERSLAIHFEDELPDLNASQDEMIRQRVKATLLRRLAGGYR